MEHDQRDELYRVGFVDGDERHIGHAEHGRIDVQRRLHAVVYGQRWIDGSDGCCNGSSCAYADVRRFADQRSIGRGVSVDVDGDQRNELRGGRRLVG